MDTRTRCVVCWFRYCCFNGAMAAKPWIPRFPSSGGTGRIPLQWGHGRKAMDTSSRLRSPTTPGALQWGHGRKAMDTRLRMARARLPSGFNGAMAAKPWILGLFLFGYVGERQASMGPWPQSHGYMSIWATVDDDEYASMGPWPQSHGYHNSSESENWESPELQWGHGRKAMDTALLKRYARRWELLQWGHGRKAMDTPLRSPCAPERRNASMGPWPQSHGYKP